MNINFRLDVLQTGLTLQKASPHQKHTFGSGRPKITMDIHDPNAS